MRASGSGNVSRPAKLPELPVRLREFLRALHSGCKRATAAEAVLRGVTSTRAPERLAAHLADLAGSWMGGDGWAVVSADEGRGVSWLADRGVSVGRRPAVTAIAQLAMAQDQVTWTDDEAWPGAVRARSRFAALALPLRSRGKIVGVLVGVETRQPGNLPHIDLDEGRLAPLHALLDGMAGALDTALHLKRAETLSTTDDLTGLFNSRFLTSALRREVKRAVRSGRPLSLLFVDLDGFKGINDRYGHLFGSRALVEAAERIHSGARETDIVARFGGDEFALILPDTGREGALLVAQRVRDRIAGQPFLCADAVNYRLTASVGAATLPDTATSPEQLLAAADAAMYIVKGRGKNGIEVAADGSLAAVPVRGQAAPSEA
ncbi:MAG: GGDEF domain-containing protein [Acidobacteria bacterium]|nr:MAG: GGDEF domain-containing protein [Acidobacteriota bacterium]